MIDIVRSGQNDSCYPAALKVHLGNHAPAFIATMGNLDILRRRKLALFCSVTCPGHLILQTYDLAQTIRQAGVTVIGGFHSPIERECLTILLRGTQPIIMCPARSIEGRRVQADYQKPLAEGRLLWLSPFAETQRRITAATAVSRNRFVAALESDANAHLLSLGAKGLSPDNLAAVFPPTWRSPTERGSDTVRG